MNTQEKIQKIENFFGKIIDKNEVLESIENLYTEKDITDILGHSKGLFSVENEYTMIQVSLNNFQYGYGHYTNRLTRRIRSFSINIQSSDIRENERTNFLLLGTEGVPDTLSTETSIEELDELIFNLSLQYGSLFSSELLLMVFVFYKQYLNRLPKRTELTFFVSTKDGFDVSDVITKILE